MTLGDFLPAAEPRLADLTSCEDWLAHVVLTDTHACSTLLTLIEEIEARPPRHSAYLQILERLRHSVAPAEEEQAKLFAGKLLPLSQDEATAFVHANGLWAAMLRAYARLLAAALNGKHLELKSSLPRLFQRVLACAGEAIGTYVLARREFGADYWKVVNQTYAVSEARAAARETVADFSDESSPMAAPWISQETRGPRGRSGLPVRRHCVFSISPASPARSTHASSAWTRAPSPPRSDWAPIARGLPLRIFSRRCGAPGSIPRRHATFRGVRAPRRWNW